MEWITPSSNDNNDYPFCGLRICPSNHGGCSLYHCFADLSPKKRKRKSKKRKRKNKKTK